MENRNYDPKKGAALFKQIMKEAAQYYGIAPHNVVVDQFRFIAAGRLNIASLRYLATYKTLKAYFFPTNKSMKVSQEVTALRRLLEKTEQA